MLAIAVELLSGRYVATSHDDREHAEWPPHPARLFSALVATWGEGDPHGEHGMREQAALEWLEQEPPPEILADAPDLVGRRTVVPVFVPVNDASQVAEVDGAKLADAESALVQAGESKERAKVEKQVAKLRAKFLADTLKAIAVPTKFGQDDRLGMRLLPDHRGRQPRTFPSASPTTPRIAFVWSTAQPDQEVVAALTGLLARVIRLGHSSSMVRAAIAGADEIARLESETTRYRPDARDGVHVIRWVEKGQVTRLCRAYDRHRETEPRVLPAAFVRYTERTATASAALPTSRFEDDLIVFARRGGPRLPITSVVGVARQFRRALMAHADEPIHPVLSGHAPDGTPSEQPHVAIVPLPVIAGPHPDGALIGLAIALPRDNDATARRAVLRAIGRYEQAHSSPETDAIPMIRLTLGAAGTLELQRLAWSESVRTLDPMSWCRPATRWATATPIALDRNPGDLHDPDPVRRRAAFDHAVQSVAQAVERIGLPQPQEIDVVRSCVLPGTAKPQRYPRFPADPGRTQRVLVHARIVFAAPVRGPVLLGAGRYQGLGMCSPVDGRGGRS